MLRALSRPLVGLVERWLPTALVFAVLFTGWRRAPVHHRLGPLLLPLYAITYALALASYWPG